MSNPNLVRKTVDPTSSNSGGEISSLSQILPPGTVLDTAAIAAPSGWFFCHGQAISRTTYSALFTAIGTTYGVGDGSTTFNLPDIRGRIRAGKDDMGGSAANRITSGNSAISGNTLGAAGGAETMMSHTHGMQNHTHSGTTGTSNQSLWHQHQQFVTANPNTGGPGIRLDYDADVVGAQQYAQGVNTGGTDLTSHNHNITTGAPSNDTTTATGAGTTHGNMPPTIIFNTIIKY